MPLLRIDRHYRFYNLRRRLIYCAKTACAEAVCVEAIGAEDRRRGHLIYKAIEGAFFTFHATLDFNIRVDLRRDMIKDRLIRSYSA